MTTTDSRPSPVPPISEPSNLNEASRNIVVFFFTTTLPLLPLSVKAYYYPLHCFPAVFPPLIHPLAAMGPGKDLRQLEEECEENKIALDGQKAVNIHLNDEIKGLSKELTEANKVRIFFL